MRKIFDTSLGGENSLKVNNTCREAAETATGGGGGGDMELNCTELRCTSFYYLRAVGRKVL